MLIPCQCRFVGWLCPPRWRRRPLHMLPSGFQLRSPQFLAPRGGGVGGTGNNPLVSVTHRTGKKKNGALPAAGVEFVGVAGTFMF